MKERILAGPTPWLIFICAFLVFLGCFGFPVYNFTPGQQHGSWYSLLVLCIGHYEAGQFLGLLNSRKKVWSSASIALVMTILGLVCRFLMEFGEVSNTYDFTIPNVLLHLAFSVVVTIIGTLFFVEHERPPLRKG